MLDRGAALNVIVPLLKDWEEFTPVAKWDVDGWMIGYGHHGPEVNQGMKIDSSRALELLWEDAGARADLIIPKLPKILNPNQLGSLISFVYNVGPGGKHKDGFLMLRNGEPSTLFKMIWAMPLDATPDQLKAIGDEFLKWIYADGQPSSGLCTRRTRERGLFLTPFSPNPLAGETCGLPAGGSEIKG